MRQASNACGRFRCTQLAVATALALAGSSAALAADEASTNGAMTFANVRVINAPQSATTPTTAPQGGMRAYKDSASGALRGPTAEEMAAAAASAPASNVARRASTASAAASEAPSFAAAGGGVGVMLDESSLQYSVVVRQADGTLAEICVTGADAANDVVKQPVLKTAAKKELSNDR